MEIKENQPIGIFDSGIGGLTIANAIKKIMPNESIMYFGDSKHLPYGDKSKEIIIKYSKEITKLLLSKKCKVVVIACNTASANAINEIKSLAHKKALVLDVISPVVKKVSYQLDNKIAVIGTKSTIDSHIYKKSIQILNPYIQIVELATPLLAPMIEEGFYNHPISQIILKTYLSNSIFSNIDSIILGCTHYPMISSEISMIFNHSVEVIDSPKIIADHLFYELKKNSLLNKNSNPEHYFYLSDCTQHFSNVAKMIFGDQINFKQIQLQV